MTAPKPPRPGARPGSARPGARPGPNAPRPPARAAGTTPQPPRPAGPPAQRPAPARPAARPGPARPAPPRPPAARDASKANAPINAGASPNPDGERLSKVMAARGIASRREADEWIEAGWVRVDGAPAVLGQRVREDQRIDVDPAARNAQAQRVTVLLHKPIGYVSGQAEDGYEPASVLVTKANHWAEDLARRPWNPTHARGLAPAGRLDIDSTGLLVLTQDGRIARHLIGDDSSVEKEYLVRVRHTGAGPFPEAGLERLRHGLWLDGRELRPAKVSWANEDQLRFVLREGRKRQIRRMCELVGLEVLGLKRVRIGSVVLGPLPPGQWRYLRDDERF